MATFGELGGAVVARLVRSVSLPLVAAKSGYIARRAMATLGEDSSLCCFFAFVDFSVVAYVFEADGDLFADA